MSAQIQALQQIPLAVIALSQTASQRERRASFDKGALEELASSIRTAGVIEPILVRRLTDGPSAKGFSFEIVAGERRYLAAKKAGLEDIPAIERELTDAEVVELQLVENLQREDLPEIAEAEGYEALAKFGYSVDQMAAKVGKSRGTVYARMKLLALEPEARKAMKEGELTPSVALLIARIPDRKLQLEAMKVVLTSPSAWGEARGKPMAYREAAEYVQEHYMLRLKEAPFPTSRDDLVKGVGACAFCPKNTACSDPKLGNLELFADVKGARSGAGVCTDPVCYHAKATAWAAIAVTKARAEGKKVIEGDRAKRILRNPHYLEGDYKRLEDRCYDDPKQRTYREVLGKQTEETVTLIVNPDTGEIVQAVKPAEALEVLRERGVKTERADTRDHYAEQNRARERKRKNEIEFRRRLFEAVVEKLPRRLDRDLLEVVAVALFDRQQHESRKAFFEHMGWKPKETRSWSGDPHKLAFEEQAGSMTEQQLSEVLVQIALLEELSVPTYETPGAKAEQLLAVAKHLKVRPEPIRKALAGELLAKRKAKRAKK